VLLAIAKKIQLMILVGVYQHFRGTSSHIL